MRYCFSFLLSLSLLFAFSGSAQALPSGSLHSIHPLLQSYSLTQQEVPVPPPPATRVERVATYLQQTGATINWSSPFTWLLVGFLYLLPAIIALIRRPEHAEVIIWSDVLLGWTLAAWVFAFIYSLGEKDPLPPHSDYDEIVFAQPSSARRLNLVTARIQDRCAAEYLCPIQPTAVPNPTPSQRLFFPTRVTASAAQSAIQPPAITWTLHRSHASRLVIEYVDASQHCTTHTLTQPRTGVDAQMHEYIGGFEGSQFRAFRADHILRSHVRAA